MKRLALVLALLSGLAAGQPALVASKPCLMDGTGCFSTAFTNITGISASKLLGRGSSGAGAAQEITPGTGLTISGTTLTPDVSGSGASGRLALWSGTGTLASDAGLTYSGTGTGTVLRIGALLTGNGSATAAAIGPSGAPNTGIYWIGANVYRITINGATAFNLGAGGTELGSGAYLGWSTNLGVTAADAIISRRAAATLQLGAADSATPVAQTIAFQGSRGGTDTNTAGADATIQGSLGTGSGASGKIVFKIGTPDASGSTQHTANTVLTLQDTGTGGTPSPAVISAGPVTSTQYRLSALNTAPSSATDTGTLGEIRIDSGYIYVCTATNTWVRAALATWP